MNTKLPLEIFIFLFGVNALFAQSIDDFTSVTPTTQSNRFVIPSSHSFQKIIEVGNALTVSGTFKVKPDFTGYVPISASSINGYLSINSEGSPLTDGGGGVTMLEVNLSPITELWTTTKSENVNFSSVGGTSANCSGTVTSWGTVITCEEGVVGDIFVPDGYNDLGWNIEVNPVTKGVIKHYAMGNMAHENVTIHANNRTVYQGADSNPGYLYKFVANTPGNLASGSLYVYTGSKSSGTWTKINNSSQAEQNSTLSQSAAAANIVVFNGIEDVEIGPDGWVYFAVKNSPDQRVYRFLDSDPVNPASTVTMETYVGGMNYDINDGNSITSVPWGSGNDNLAFDGNGNLWVFQDGGNNYIWVVKAGHTQVSPKVEIFGIAPIGSEPTGITFTPDFKYLFMSIQHPNTGNIANQLDAAGNVVNFNKGVSLVIALQENLGSPLSIEDFNKSTTNFQLKPNPTKCNGSVIVKGDQIKNIKVYSILGKQLFNNYYNGLQEVELYLKNLQSGLYLVQINNAQTKKLVIN